MKLAALLVTLLFSAVINVTAQNYNPLWIPDTLSGKEFNLTMEEGHEHWFGPNSLVMTAGFNPQTTGHYFWGPTLIIRKGDTVKMNVTNNLKDTTTVHWHGMHLPAIMDGGPHQPIAPGATWKPYWKVMNNAATYWYHPHLHMMAQEQLLMGLGGMMIVRDADEDKLALPRTYGVDDIPLALSDRAFTTAGEISIEPYGDSMQVNGVIRAEYTVPSQVVRFRILNASTERSYNLGFSDGRKFSVITSDGGLLNSPVELSRYLLSSGERIEILVNFGADKGKSVKLRAFNSVLPQNIPGGDRFPNGPFANILARIDFDVLNINIGNPTANPITTIPTQLAIVAPLKEADAFVTRKLTISDTMIPGNTGTSFVLNRRLFDENYIDYKVGLNNTEIWEIANSGNFAHPFHIHDVQFNVLTRNGQVAKPEEAGWKDVVLVKARETVRFIARFDDFADSTAPYMFHCHIALHEDEGMMGQFVVVDNGSVPTISFMSSAVLQAREGVKYTYQAKASANVKDPITFALISGPAGLTIDQNSGLVTWTNPVKGTYDVSLGAYMVSNGKNYGAVQNYKLSVTPPLTVTFTSTPVVTGTEGTAYAYTVRARCSDTTKFLNYRFVDSVAGMSLTRQGQLSWAQPKAGTYNIAVRASVFQDTVNAIQRYVLTITGSNAPRVTFTSAPPLSGTEKVPYEYQVVASCSDSTKSLEFSLRDSVSGMTLTKSGLFQWPSPVVGTYPIRIRAKVVGDTLFSDQRFTLVIKADTTMGVSDQLGVIGGCRIYPQPVGNSFTLEFDQPLQAEVRATLTDAIGCRISGVQLNVGLTATSFDTGLLGQGVYMLVLESGTTSHAIPVVIRR